MYRAEPYSVGLFAKLCNRSLLEAMGYLIGDPKMPIRCADGTSETYANAQIAVKKDRPVVIGPSALCSIFHSNVWKNLSSLPKNYIVTYATLDIFREQRRNPNSRLHSKRIGGAKGGKPFFQTRTDEDIEREAKRISDFIDWVQTNAKLVGGRCVLKISKSKRDEIAHAFPYAMIESVGAAIDNDAVLWSDEIMLPLACELAQPRVWSEIELSQLNELGLIQDKDLHEFILFLIGTGYTFIRFNKGVLDHAIAESRWEVGNSQLQYIVDWIHKSGVESNVAAGLTSELLGMAWKRAPFAHQRSNLLRALAHSIGKRNDALEVFKQVAARLPNEFGTNVVGLRECQKVLKSAANRALRYAPIILPGDPDWSMPW